MHWTIPLLGLKFNPYLVAVVLGIFIIYYLYTRKTYKKPPGPLAIPVLGNLIQVMLAKKVLYKKFVDWSHEYGKIFSFYLGGYPCVVLNDIDLVLEATVKKQTEFAGRVRTFTIDLISSSGKGIVSADYGPEWKLGRKIAFQAMRNYALGKNLEVKIHECFNSVGKVLQTKKEPVLINHYISLIVYNFICGFVWGQTYEIEDEKFKRFMDISDTLNGEIGNGLPEDIFPILQYFPSAKRDRILKYFKEFLDILDEKYKDHVGTFDRDHIRDFIDDLLLSRLQAQEENSEDVKAMDYNYLFRIIIDIFGAGTDTSRFTLNWAIYLMTLYPDVQDKVQAEIDANIGKERLPGLADKEKLVYTEGTLMEVIRIKYIIPLGIPHKALVDSTIGGYDVPKDTWVFINHWALHMDPKHWKDPETFDPHRFIDPDGTHAPKPVSYLPFSAGRRVCLGEAVAKPELLMLFACLMQRFHFSIPPGEDPPKEPSTGESLVNLPPVDLKVVVTSRV